MTLNPKKSLILAIFSLYGSSAFAGFPSPTTKCIVENNTRDKKIKLTQKNASGNILNSIIQGEWSLNYNYNFKSDVASFDMQIDNYVTTIHGLQFTEPSPAFDVNNDNGFETIEFRDHRSGPYCRIPVTSQAVPLINSTQTMSVNNPIWPKKFPLNNRSSQTVTITQFDRNNNVLFKVTKTPKSEQIWIDIASGINHLEIKVGDSTIKLYSFKYNDPELSFEDHIQGIRFKDGTYDYFVTGNNVPLIKIK